MNILTQNFTIHINNAKTPVEVVMRDMETMFGPARNADDVAVWYVSRNYDRLFEESVMEITFLGAMNNKHFLFNFIHPWSLLAENTITYNVGNSETNSSIHFNNLFETA